jgi:hypothetical protein
MAGWKYENEVTRTKEAFLLWPRKDPVTGKWFWLTRMHIIQQWGLFPWGSGWITVSVLHVPSRGRWP